MNEHRSSHRRQTLKAAKLLLSGSTLLDCLVRDISETGARLEFPGPSPLPPEFRLRVVADRTEAPAALAWQRGLAAGVHFGAPLR